MSMKTRYEAEIKSLTAFIEDNLKSEITMSILARRINYSPAYTARIFKEATGQTLFEYIRDRRLEAAAERLSTEDRPRVLDIALDFTFDSHEGFTRAFSKKFGLPPKEYRRKTFLPQNTAVGTNKEADK